MFHLDYQSRDPIYLQIKNKIMEMIVVGVYPPGTQLPSVRTLATELGINPNTIQKAYQELESSGVIHSVSGKGSFVSGQQEARREMQQRVLKTVAEAIHQARLAGASKEALAELLTREFEGEKL